MRVLIWGTGKIAKRCSGDLLAEHEIIGYIESEKCKYEFLCRPVFGGDEIDRLNYDSNFPHRKY